MLPKDANGNYLQIAQHVPGTLQRLAPLAAAVLKLAKLSARAVGVGVRVRSVAGIAHIRLGDTNVVADITDATLTNDDGWQYLSLFGQDIGGVSFRAEFVSVYAESATVNIDIVEIH